MCPMVYGRHVKRAARVEMINLQQVRKYSSYNGKMDFEKSNLYVISVFRREVDENCALLGYYVARQW